MYSQTLLTTSGRGNGAAPTMAASSCEGWKGLRKADVCSWVPSSADFACPSGSLGFDVGMLTSSPQSKHVGAIHHCAQAPSPNELHLGPALDTRLLHGGFEVFRSRKCFSPL